MDKTLTERAKKIKLLLMDCDGVLTDGKLYFGETGELIKSFDVRDGHGIVKWHNAGFVSGIISGRKSKAVERRANELGVKYLRQGSQDKVSDFEELLKETGYTPEQTSYIGDDVSDIPLLKIVGLSFTVSNAASEVFANVDVILRHKGGCGAVRELIDMLLVLKTNN